MKIKNFVYVKFIFVSLCVILSVATTKCGGSSSQPTYDTKTLSVNYYPQETSYTCQSACIRIYLDYRYTKKGFMWDPYQRKRVPDESVVYNQIQEPKTMYNICLALNYFLWMGGYSSSYTALYTYYTENAQLRHQKSCIDNDEPILVLFGKSSPFGKQHNVIMYGYRIKSSSTDISDIDTIYYHDPWFGSAQKNSKSEWANNTSHIYDNDPNMYSISKYGI